MAQKHRERSFEVSGDLRTDYALMSVGAGAALIALLYLVLT